MTEETRFLGWWTSKRDLLAGAAAVTAGLALVVGACGVLGGSFGESIGAGLDAPCRDTLGRPLTARDVIAAFEAEGFEMYSLPESFYCNPGNFAAGGAAVADVSNRRGIGMDVEATNQQGWVTCNVYDEGQASLELETNLNVGADSLLYAGTKAIFDLANVTCSHYPPQRNPEIWTERAHDAMKRLEKRLASGAARP